MSSRGRKRKAEVAFATQSSGNNGSDGSASRSLRPRLNSAAVTVSSTSSPSGSAASSSTSRAPLKSNQQQRQEATKQRRSQRQINMAEEQRKKRAQHRAQLKQLKAQAAATAGAAAAAAAAKAAAAKAAAAAALKNPAHWEAVDRAHGNKHLVRLTSTKHRAELTAVKRHWTKTNGFGRVISVHRIQNRLLHRRFEKMRKSHPKLAEKVAYHGTRANVPSSIYDSRTGFDMRRGMYAPGSVVNHAQCYGEDYLWFAQHAAYSSSGYWHGVRQATLPFGPPALVYNPVTYTYTAPYKQILRVRLLLSQTNKSEWTGGIVTINQSERCLPEYLITFK